MFNLTFIYFVLFSQVWSAMVWSGLICLVWPEAATAVTAAMVVSVVAAVSAGAPLVAVY